MAGNGTNAMRDKVFVSYSHRDRRWRTRIKKDFGSGIYRQAFEIWSDKDIEAGSLWRQKIEAAIASSRIALLLVSRNFLKSDFIIKAELPSILRRNETMQSEGGLNGCIFGCQG